MVAVLPRTPPVLVSLTLAVGLSAYRAEIHLGDARRVWAEIKNDLSSVQARAMPYRLRRDDGVYRWMDAGAEPFLDDDGSIVQGYGLPHDIDGHWPIEETLREPDGMAMGPAISRSIVNGCGGRPLAENNQHGGDTFIFTLPAEAKADHDR